MQVELWQAVAADRFWKQAENWERKMQRVERSTSHRIFASIAKDVFAGASSGARMGSAPRHITGDGPAVFQYVLRQERQNTLQSLSWLEQHIVGAVDRVPIALYAFLHQGLPDNREMMSNTEAVRSDCAFGIAVAVGFPLTCITGATAWVGQSVAVGVGALIGLLVGTTNVVRKLSRENDQAPREESFSPGSVSTSAYATGRDWPFKLGCVGKKYISSSLAKGSAMTPCLAFRAAVEDWFEAERASGNKAHDIFCAKDYFIKGVQQAAEAERVRDEDEGVWKEIFTPDPVVDVPVEKLRFPEMFAALNDVVLMLPFTSFR